MLAKTLLTLVASALAVSAGRIVEERGPVISCGDVFVRSSLVQTGGVSGKDRPLGFQGAKDASGRNLLTTSFEGVAATGKQQFEFVQCNSTVLPDGIAVLADGYQQMYGQLRLKADRTQCLTATKLNNDQAPAPLAMRPCQRADNSGLATQWWASTYTPADEEDEEEHTAIYLRLVGNSQLTPESGYYAFKNVAQGRARLLETVFVRPSVVSQPSGGDGQDAGAGAGAVPLDARTEQEANFFLRMVRKA
ncbi:hypothetical protein OC842_004718 [Tilletia horrida]|uniref:Ricin B lectin domain-containing protein n=1 Tax=Tilletia horrida TaxID=155126 RepID=A0AAN6JQ09_9BASI|nr:hypothetical protein OC842_004718 [Tilletia horrida]